MQNNNNQTPEENINNTENNNETDIKSENNTESNETVTDNTNQQNDSWWQSGGIGVPIESRMHDLSDGFAILAPTSQPIS